jgi:hypothetical protein
VNPETRCLRRTHLVPAISGSDRPLQLSQCLTIVVCPKVESSNLFFQNLCPPLKVIVSGFICHNTCSEQGFAFPSKPLDLHRLHPVGVANDVGREEIVCSLDRLENIMSGKTIKLVGIARSPRVARQGKRLQDVAHWRRIRRIPSTEALPRTRSC